MFKSTGKRNPKSKKRRGNPEGGYGSHGAPAAWRGCSRTPGSTPGANSVFTDGRELGAFATKVPKGQRKP